MRTWSFLCLRAYTHGGWLQRQRVSTSFLPLKKKLTTFFLCSWRDSNSGHGNRCCYSLDTYKRSKGQQTVYKATTNNVLEKKSAVERAIGKSGMKARNSKTHVVGDRQCVDVRSEHLHPFCYVELFDSLCTHPARRCYMVTFCLWGMHVLLLWREEYWTCWLFYRL